MAKSKSKGRKGQTFTRKQIIEIRKRIAGGEKAVDIAPEYDVFNTTISSIARGETYKNIGGPRTRINKTRKSVIKADLNAKKPRPPGTRKSKAAPTDLAAMPVDRAARYLQGMTAEWPQIVKAAEAILIMDEIVRGES